MKSLRLYRLMIVIAAFCCLLFTGACTGSKEDNSPIAFVSLNQTTAYEKTFKELHLGTLFEFQLELPYAKESWLNLWVEGYHHGQPLDPFHLAEISTGMWLKQVEKGPLVVALLDTAGNSPSILLHALGGSTSIPIAEVWELEPNAGSSWSYAIGEDQIGLVENETKLLAVYRRIGNQAFTYSYEDPESIQKMIQDDPMVLLIKMKITRIPPS